MWRGGYFKLRLFYSRPTVRRLGPMPDEKDPDGDTSSQASQATFLTAAESGNTTSSDESFLSVRSKASLHSGDNLDDTMEGDENTGTSPLTRTFFCFFDLVIQSIKIQLPLGEFWHDVSNNCFFRRVCTESSSNLPHRAIEESRGTALAQASFTLVLRNCFRAIFRRKR